ncbi:hypothetical protein BSL78_16049 [Apostichopus japonicus]|uniref:VWFA domain-containing protein n=1 Tax=Stichopus japonicus TaxID=307972 RepID=A0A2G8KGH5_STIJA|nr:hypothetical protein BSL78_16049 [Apostichopus japonicus]
MAGTKLMQTKSGIIAILRSLPIDDKFNIVTFANNAYKWKPDFVFASKKQITSASRFINMLHPHGGTNIKEALIVAAKSFKDVQRIYRSIVFLTDGVPSVGSTDSARITTSVTNICSDRIAIFCIGIGNELDESLLRNLARNNRGRYSQIEASDKASDEMRTFFQDNIKPVLYDVNIISDQEVVVNSTLTRSNFLAYMDGQEILVAGMISDRLKQPFLNVTISGEGKDGKKIFLVKNRLNLVDMKRTKRNIDDNRVLERLWAFTKIKDLSHQLRTRRSAYDKSISASRMLQLSHKYGFLTPVTTLSLPLSGKSDDGGDFIISNIQLSTARVTTLPRNMYQILKWTPIYEPFALQNGSVSRVFGDPHFVIDIPLSNLTICFDIQRKEGDILMLIVDDAIGLLVNGEIVQDITSGTKILSLFGRLGITLGSSRLFFSPDRILIDSKMSVSWKKPCRITIDKFNLVIHDRQNVTVTHGDGMRMLIQLHTRIKHPSYFDLFLEDNDGFSSGASGIIGKFKNIAFHISFQSISTDQDKATLMYRHKQIPVRRRNNPFAKDSFCWHGRAEDFIDDIEEFTYGKLCS